MKIVGGPSFGS